MSDDKVATEEAWQYQCVPDAFPNGAHLTDGLRTQLISFLGEASHRPLKPTELSKLASDLARTCLGSTGDSVDEAEQNRA
jgi:hypothetical protein